MKMLQIRTAELVERRRGSTLLIVLSLLSLLAFLGMVFLTFSSQERAAAEYFSEAAKSSANIPDDPFPWALKQILTGPDDHQKASILWSSQRRHAILQGAVGTDTVPYNGAGIIIGDDGTGVPEVQQDLDRDGTPDIFVVGDVGNPLEFVDSLAAWAGPPFNLTEAELLETRALGPDQLFPYPDVDYTYPDINNLFLAYRGWAIRDNGSTHTPADERYERVPVFIPSFMRPGLMKSGAGAVATLTDRDWYDHSVATGHPEFSVRSMRPSELHTAGFDASGGAVRRYLDETDAGDAVIIAALPGGHGGFPLRPGEDVNTSDFGKLGVFTGHDPGTAPATGSSPDSDNMQLDSDNDRDSIKEGIWIDTAYPIQETASGVLYATLHSFTIYDLDSLIDLNSHGNMAEVARDGDVPTMVGAQMANTLLSASNQGLGPNEVSPLYALAPPDTVDSDSTFTDWYSANPTNRLEQANMQWLWMLTGRINGTDAAASPDVFDGRWGDATALWYHRFDATAARSVWSLPRPGRAGRLADTTTDSISFGGYLGYDDNQDYLEGIAHSQTGVIRGFMHPLDIGGTGSTVDAANPMLPLLFTGDTLQPQQWLQYDGFPLVGDSSNVLNDSLFLRGADQDITTTADNQYVNPQYNMAVEDPLEFINDLDKTLHPDDQMFRPADLVPAHLDSADVASAESSLSSRLNDLAPIAFADGSTISERFTTISNSLRSLVHRHDLGNNLLSEGGAGDDGPRWWEWSADTDGDDSLEFPPEFATAAPFSEVDPFRAVTRRLLTSEAGEQRDLMTQLPLSLNHVLDVNRTSDTPLEGSVEFFEYLQRSGMKFRPLTEHPDAAESNPAGGTFAELESSDIPKRDTAAGLAALRAFPPQSLAHREFWARRDRQQLARDIYVLLYTTGGAQVDGSGNYIVDYTASNAGQVWYSHEQMRRMAQFAVNLVDAMDTDNVITKFEYDKDLGNGWNLDDDPYTEDPAMASNGAGTGGGTHTFDTATRGVVLGVEAQQLSFSESLAVRLEDFAKLSGTSDDAATMFDDLSALAPISSPDTTRKDRYVLHLELQNNQPYPVELSVDGVTGTASTGDGDQAIWQLARVDRTGASSDAQDVTPVQTLNFMDGNGDVSGGARFSIAMATTANTVASDALRTDPLGIGVSDLYLQPPSTTDYSLISPDVTAAAITTGATPTPGSDLDLIHSSHDGRYVFDVSNTDKGRFLEDIEYDSTATQYVGNDVFDLTAATAPDVTTAETGQGFEVVLRRRQNPHLPLLDISENGWVEVDRIRVEFKDLFNFTDDGMGNYTATAEFDQITSDERIEPLNAQDLSDSDHPAAATDSRYNTIGSGNDRNIVGGVVTNPFTMYQPHFDRDFASIVELFHLPVVAPHLLTYRLDRMRFSPYQQVHDDPRNAPVTMGTTAETNNISSGVAMFLQPEWPSTDSDARNLNGNAWYRLLQFVEVPSRINRMLGNYLNLSRLPGKVNINNLRHVEVYAGLLDDSLLADVPQDTQFAPFMSDTSTLPGISEVHDTLTSVINLTDGTNDYKDRWFELLQERDGPSLVYDAVGAADTVFWVPGTPRAKPFRSLGHRSFSADTGSGDSGLADTVFRALAPELDDASALTNRTPLEIGEDTYHNDPDTPGAFSSSNRERHQLASKIVGNTTTVSNTFIVYATAAYFEAYQDASGLFRIGGRMGLDLDSDSDEQNDAGWEQRAVFVIDRTELVNAYDEGSGSFDWERLIKYRADLTSDEE